MTPSARRPKHRGVPRAEAPAGSDRVAVFLTGLLLALLLLRALLSFSPTMWLWSLNLQRFMPVPAAWLLWSVCAVALVPAVGRALVPALTAFGEAIRRPGVLTPLALALAAAALVWMLPDRLQYTGDFKMRFGAVMKGESPVLSSPQVFPLDELLHYTLPRLLVTRLGLSVDHAVRLVGAVGAGALAWAACGFARALQVGGVATAAAAAIVLFGGYLGVFTGESKAFSTLCVLFVAFAACAVRVVRDGRGLVGLGVAFALALPLHRYALGLLPALVWAWVAWLRMHRGDLRAHGATIAAALVPPLAAAVLLSTRLFATTTTFDLAANFLTPRVSQRGVLGEAFAPLRLLDLANLVLMLSPLVASVPLLAILRKGEATRHHEVHVLRALVVPFALLMLFTHPPGGLLRYWDVFVPVGVGASLLTAWWIAGALEVPRRAWLAAAVIAAVAVPSVQWLYQFSDPARGSARIETLMTEPPRRAADDAWSHWDFLGWHRFERDDMAGAARAWKHAAEAAPTPHTLVQWGMAEAAQGHHDVARGLYRQSVERDTALVLGWIGVAVEAIAFEDLAETEEAARRLQRLAPDNPKTLEILDYLRQARGAAP